MHSFLLDRLIFTHNYRSRSEIKKGCDSAGTKEILPHLPGLMKGNEIKTLIRAA